MGIGRNRHAGGRERGALTKEATEKGGAAAPLARGKVPAAWGTAVVVAAAMLGMAWGTLCWRAAWHYRTGVLEEERGMTMSAAREFESALGCYAPLNPYCRASAERMLALSSREMERSPALAAEIRDRLGRSLRSARWLVQPYGDLLAEVTEGRSRAPSRDPRALPFFLSTLALIVGFGAWWVPWRLGARAALSSAGLCAWAFLLYLC